MSCALILRHDAVGSGGRRHGAGGGGGPCDAATAAGPQQPQPQAGSHKWQQQDGLQTEVEDPL